MSAQTVPHLNPEEFLAYERSAEQKHEYCNGEIFDMSGGTVTHKLITHNLELFLGNLLRKEPCLVLSNDVRLGMIASRSFTYPDLMVVCGEPSYAAGPKDTILNPILIVEVLSKSTESHDRGFKLKHYLRIESLKEYVLVSQAEPRVEKYSRGSEGNWILSEAEGMQSSLALECLDWRVPLAEIYAKVTLPAE